MEFCKFLRISFFTEHLWWLLLEGVCEGINLVKSCSSVILIYLESVTDAIEGTLMQVEKALTCLKSTLKISQLNYLSFCSNLLMKFAIF